MSEPTRPRDLELVVTLDYFDIQNTSVSEVIALLEDKEAQIKAAIEHWRTFASTIGIPPHLLDGRALSNEQVTA